MSNIKEISHTIMPNPGGKFQMMVRKLKFDTIRQEWLWVTHCVKHFSSVDSAERAFQKIQLEILAK